MGQYTTRFAFYLAGGGSTGTITPDEQVDIDKINDTLRAIDTELGLPVRTRSSVTKPAPGALAKDTDGEIYYYVNGGWANILPARLQSDAPASYYTKNELDNGKLDNRYYTQNNLLNDGKLDDRYYTKSTTYAKTAIDQMYLAKASSGTSQPKLAWGTGTVTADTFDGTTNTYKKAVTVSYSGFTNPPGVFAIPQSQDSGYMDFTLNSTPTTTGATLVFRRRNSETNTFYWFAIGS